MQIYLNYLNGLSLHVLSPLPLLFNKKWTISNLWLINSLQRMSRLALILLSFILCEEWFFLDMVLIHLYFRKVEGHLLLYRGLLRILHWLFLLIPLLITFLGFFTRVSTPRAQLRFHKMNVSQVLLLFLQILEHFLLARRHALIPSVIHFYFRLTIINTIGNWLRYLS